MGWLMLVLKGTGWNVVSFGKFGFSKRWPIFVNDDDFLQVILAGKPFNQQKKTWVSTETPPERCFFLY